MQINLNYLGKPTAETDWKNDKVNTEYFITKFLFFVDYTYNDLRRFQNFLYGNLNKLEQYDNMYPKSNQPSRFFARTQTYKFDWTLSMIWL